MASAQFLIVADLTIVNVALPSIQEGLGFAPVDLQWVANAYSLAFGGFLLLGGRAADLFGRRRVFVAGLLLFTAGSVVNGLAPTQGTLIAGRALQGLGAALISPSALSIIMTTFSGKAERTRALSVWAGVSIGGGAAGLLLGGVLTQTLSWEWIFLAAVPVGLTGAVAGIQLIPESRSIPESRGDRQHGFDAEGAISVTAGLVVIVYATVQAQSAGWRTGNTLGLFAVGLFLLALFLVIEQSCRSPLVRLSILRSRPVAIGNAGALLSGGGLISMFYFTSLYLQDILGYGPMQAGLAFLPPVVGTLAGVVVAQRLLVRLPAWLVSCVGLGVAALGSLLLLRLAADSSYLDLLPGFVLIAVGSGLSLVPLTLLATSGVDAQYAGLASGLFNTSRQIGGALGLAALATLAAGHTHEEPAGAAASAAQAALAARVHGIHVAFTGTAVLFAASIGLLAAFQPGRQGVGRQPGRHRAAPGTGSRYSPGRPAPGHR